MHYIYFIEILSFAFISSSVWGGFIQINISYSIFSLFNILLIHFLSLITGIIITNSLSRFTISCFIEKPSQNYITNILSVVINIFIIILSIVLLYLSIIAVFFTRFISLNNFYTFACTSGLLNGNILCLIVENKLHKISSINKKEKVIGYFIYSTIYLTIIYLTINDSIF